jgi:hypothetical protein
LSDQATLGMGYGARWNYRECVRISHAKAGTGGGASRHRLLPSRLATRLLALASLLTLGPLARQALAQDADAGLPQAHASGATPNAAVEHASGERPAAFPPKQIDPGMLSERVLGGLRGRAPSLGAAVQAANVEATSTGFREARKTRTLAIETSDGVTVLSNQKLGDPSLPEAPSARAEVAAVVPAAVRPPGETILEPRQSTRTHSLRAGPSGAREGGALGLGWAVPMLLLLASSTVAGALWWRKKTHERTRVPQHRGRFSSGRF